MSQASAADGLQTLLRIMACLRHPEFGCPWDLQQSFSSIAPHTLEEACEVIDTIERADLAHLPEELGDLLFQVVFYARLGEEAGLFDFSTIAMLISRKLLQRHPHVFPDATLDSFGTAATLKPETIGRQWEEIKAVERKHNQRDDSILADVPLALTALLRAAKLQKRAARHGLDWPGVAEVECKLEEELAELREALISGNPQAVETEFGDLLFTVVNLGRHLGLDAETALRGANRKFEQRVRSIEALLGKQGQRLEQLDAAALDEYWQQVKSLEIPQ